MSAPAWMSDGACRNHAPEKFDATTGEVATSVRVLKAKTVCGNCPVRVQCLEFGLEEDFGVYGGLTPLERKELREEKLRGRACT